MRGIPRDRPRIGWRSARAAVTGISEIGAGDDEGRDYLARADHDWRDVYFRRRHIERAEPSMTKRELLSVVLEQLKARGYIVDIDVDTGTHRIYRPDGTLIIVAERPVVPPTGHPVN